MRRIIQIIVNAFSPKAKTSPDKKEIDQTSGSTELHLEEQSGVTLGESTQARAGRFHAVRGDLEKDKLPGPHIKTIEKIAAFQPRTYSNVQGVGNLLIEKRIGAGHSGEVFLGKTEEGEEFAVKEILSWNRGVDPLYKDAAGLHRANGSGATPNFCGAFKKRGDGYIRLEPDSNGNFPENVDFVLMEAVKGNKAFEVIEEGATAEKYVETLVSDLVNKLANKNLIIKDDNPANFYLRLKEGMEDLELIALDGASIHRNYSDNGYGRPSVEQIKHSISLISKAIIVKGREYRARQSVAASTQ